MPSVKLENYDDIMERLVAKVISRTNLTDLTNSSALYHILSGVARVLDDGNYQLELLAKVMNLNTAEGDDLDERALEIGSLTRLGGLFATGQVVFTRATNTGVTLNIPAGTVVRSVDGQSYTTQALVSITNVSVEQISGHGVGRDSLPVTVIANDIGEDFNAAVGTVTRFAAKPAGVSEVYNTTAVMGGRDEESDDEFRERIQLYVNSLGSATVNKLELTALGVTSNNKTVRFAKAIVRPDEPGFVRLYVDDGAGTAEETTTITNETVITASASGGEEFANLDFYPVKTSSTFTLSSSLRGTLIEDTDYFLNPTNGQIFFDPALSASEVITATTYTYFINLIAEVQRNIDGDPNNRTDYPGVAAAGERIYVLSPVVRDIAVSGALTVLQGYNLTDIITECETAITGYINNLGISGDVIYSELIEQIMNVPGVYDVNLTVPDANIDILDNEIPRITTADIDLE